MAIEQQRYSDAIDFLEQADASKALPEFVSQNIVYNLSQLYAQQDKIRKSLSLLERWLSVQKKSKKSITSEQHIFAATLYGRQKKYAFAVPHVKQAIKQSKTPKESWYQMLISFYLQQKHYNDAIKTYHVIIKQFPDKKTYWIQLSGLYLQTNKTQKALAVLELAEKQGMITTEEDILRLVNLYLYADIPLSAATLLEQKISHDKIEPNIKNQQKLADSWILAQEYSKAIKVLSNMARQEPDNGLYPFKIGRLLMEQGQWLEAYNQFNDAAQKKQDNPGEVFLLQGVAAFYAKKPEKAQFALEKAAKYKKYAEQASQWIE